MGQGNFKSSCCTNQEVPLNTEIDVGGQDNYRYNGRANVISPSSGNPNHLYTTNNQHDDIYSNAFNSSQKIRNQAKIYSQIENSNADSAYRAKQLVDAVRYAPVLHLKVISSSSLPKGTVITINAQGVVGSFRNGKDGITYFGCKKRAKRVSKHVRQTEILNDFIIPPISQEIAKKHRGRHFKIEYNITQNCYKIKDLGIGFGTFYKLDFPLVLKDNHLLNMGLIFIIANFPSEENAEAINQRNAVRGPGANGTNTLLQLKCFGGPCQGEVHTLEPSNRPYRIGRHEECEIHIEDNLLSKFQCSAEYTEGNGWILKDGKDNKPSTNGTWLYIGEEQTIYNGMIFKASQTLFQAAIEDTV